MLYYAADYCTQCTGAPVQLACAVLNRALLRACVHCSVSYYYSFRRKVETLDQNVEGLRGHLQQLVTIARTYCKAGNAFCEHGRELSSALMHLQVCSCVYLSIYTIVYMLLPRCQLILYTGCSYYCDQSIVAYMLLLAQALPAPGCTAMMCKLIVVVAVTGSISACSVTTAAWCCCH
jgi:hypothetical protein